VERIDLMICKYSSRLTRKTHHLFAADTAARSTAVKSYKSSSEDEIANVNVYDDIVHVEARAYAH